MILKQLDDRFHLGDARFVPGTEAVVGMIVDKEAFSGGVSTDLAALDRIDKTT